MDTLEKIPWYRTRWFWGVVFVATLLFAIGIIYLLLSGLSSLNVLQSAQLLGYIMFATGGLLWATVGYNSLGTIGGFLVPLLYYALQGFLVYRTFSMQKVRILYPTIFFIIYIVSILSMNVAGG